MRKRLATGTAVGIIFLAMLGPILLLPGDSDRIERFLLLRARVLTTLNGVPAPDEAGLHRIAHPGRPWDCDSPTAPELHRVIRARGWWRQQSQQVTYLVAEHLEPAGNSVPLKDRLLKLETAGLRQAGLRLLSSGDTRRETEVTTTAAVQVWSDPEHYLTVIVQATVPAGTHEVHVSKHLIEQCPIRL